MLKGKKNAQAEGGGERISSSEKIARANKVLRGALVPKLSPMMGDMAKMYKNLRLQGIEFKSVAVENGHMTLEYTVKEVFDL